MIQQLLGIMIELRKASNQTNLTKVNEEICIKILGKKYAVKSYKRVRTSALLILRNIHTMIGTAM